MKESTGWVLGGLFILILLFGSAILAWIESDRKVDRRSKVCEKLAQSVKEYNECMESK